MPSNPVTPESLRAGAASLPVPCELLVPRQMRPSVYEAGRGHLNKAWQPLESVDVVMVDA